MSESRDTSWPARIADYAVIGAARDLVQDTGYKVKDYDKDDGDFVKDLRQAGIGLSLSAFQPGVLAVIDNTEGEGSQTSRCGNCV